MTDYTHAAWLALLHGLTEFLPVSSTAHLALLPRLVGWHDQGTGFDVAVHVGTLLAVVWYLRADLAAITRDWCATLAGRAPTEHSRLGWALLAATAITAGVALPLAGAATGVWRAPLPVAIATLVFGVALGLADSFGTKRRALTGLRPRDVLIIGVSQAVAVIPGVSRSGITISAALMLGFSRAAAARFSFLLAVPTIALAGAWQARALLTQPAPVRWDILAVAALLSALIALATIHWFIGFVQRHSLWPFALYRIALGVILLLAFG